MRRLLSSARGASWTRRADLFLVALAVLGLGIHTLTESTRRMNPRPYLAEKMGAATRAIRCFEAIREARLGTPSSQDTENDPEGSGLIGQEFTLTTTDRGVLEAKLTSVNPNFAAVFVEYFKDMGLERGDAVAIALTGSFPALNVTVLAAAEELGLRALPITSVGASMWGANDPSFTWLDMETLLNRQGLLATRSIGASIGGSNDRGRGLSPRGRALLREAIERNGVALIREPTLDESVKKRLEMYREAAGPAGVRAFVNVGGGAAATGTQQNSDLIPPGVNRSLKPYNWTQRGVIHYFGRERIPFVHVLNIESIAQANGLPTVPERVPPVGEGEVFYREMYDLRIAGPALAVYLVLCFGVLRARHRAAQAARVVEVPAAITAIGAEPVSQSRG